MSWRVVALFKKSILEVLNTSADLQVREERTLSFHVSRWCQNVAWNVSSAPFRSTARIRCSLEWAPRTQTCGGSCKRKEDDREGEESSRKSIKCQHSILWSMLLGKNGGRYKGCKTLPTKGTRTQLKRQKYHAKRDSSRQTCGGSLFFFFSSQHLSAPKRGMFQTRGNSPHCYSAKTSTALKTEALEQHYEALVP